MDSPKTIFYRRTVCPCKDCDTRTADCHPNCEKYKEWQAAKNKEKQKAYKTYMAERETTEYQIEMCRKRKKRWNK